MKNFNSVPVIKAPRSRFDLSYDVKTSMNVGTLYPIYVQEIYPGDTFNCDTSFVSRLTSSYLRPVMDNLFLDVMYFFVPNRLVFEKFAEIFGENNNSAWAQPQEVEAPYINGAFSVASKTVGDYLGLPVGRNPAGVSLIPFRAFAKIYDDWFRDENIIDPMYIRKDSFHIDELPNESAWSPNNYTGKLPKVAKFHDIFTSALPGTQKSAEPVTVPIGNYAPIIANGNNMSALGGDIKLEINTATPGAPAPLGLTGGVETSNVQSVYAGLGDASNRFDNAITKTNLVADLGSSSLVSIPDLRYAFQIQRILERSARSGSRYVEYLLSAFGVQSPDARLQRSEYLGGKRIPLSTQQVAQTTRQGEDDTALGSLGAFSLTNGKCGYSKGFVEHGFVIGVACIRQHHTYQQGIEKFWQRTRRFDFYDPALAHISEQPIYKSELFAESEDETKGNVFGFNEAWYDLRSRPSMVTGDMRSASETSLDIWHFADDYENAPTLNEQFINETPEYVDRTIAVPSTSVDQFIVDIFHKQTAIRRLPVYSVPGLIDHN